MAQKSVTVKQLAKCFNLQQIAGNEEALKREISFGEVNRPGFELAGYFDHSEYRRVVVFGEKETAYIEQMSEVDQRERFDKITNESTPMIIICKDLDCSPILLEIAKNKNFPIFKTFHATGRFCIEISNYLDEQLAPETLIHGVFLDIYGHGVIIKGDSGIGKSEIALELIKRGHLLVADDAVELTQVGQKIIGKSPSVLKNLLEIRGIGVIDVVQMFGVGSVKMKDQVDMIIQLERWVPSREYTRIGLDDKPITEEILGVQIDKLVIPVTGGRNMSVVIEAAVMNAQLRELGYDSSKEFINRILNNLQGGEE